MNRTVILLLLALAACKTATDPRVDVQKVFIEKSVPCLSAEDAAKLRALLPGPQGPWLADVKRREGIYLDRLSRYRAFTDATLVVLPNCTAVP